MSWWPLWINAWLPLAALCCALIPLLIHILPRRPVRTVRWAPMALLLSAHKQQHRRLLLSNLLLLLLRVAALLLLGFLAGGPYWLGGDSGRAARHQVILIDNSLSMNQQTRSGPAMERAKVRAHQIVDEAADGSRFSIAQLVSQNTPATSVAERGLSTSAASHLVASTTNKTEAHAAIDAVVVQDAYASASQAEQIVEEISTWSHGKLTLAVTLLTDGAAHAFSPWQADVSRDEDGSAMRPTIYVERLVEQPAENAWVSAIVPQDELIETGEVTSITAEVCRWSPQAERVKIPVTLKVNERQVAAGDIDFQAGQTRSRVVFRHRFQTDIADGIDWQAVSVEIGEDALEDDNRRCQMVPVACRVPVLFVEPRSAGEDESSSQTTLLRRLFEREGAPRQLLQIRHVDLEELDERNLASARLVVLAGIEDPASKVDLLTRFVRQGGQLLIFGGGRFNPTAWNQVAWRSGQGILPAPFDLPQYKLENAPRDQAHIRLLALDNLEIEPLMSWPNASVSEMHSLFSEVQFARILPLDLGAAGPNIDVRLRADDQRPLLVTWHPELPADHDQSVASHTTGSVALFASGLTHSWNSLSQSGAFLLLDRLVREMLRGGLPLRNLAVGQEVKGQLITARGCQTIDAAGTGIRYCATGNPLESDLRTADDLSLWPEFSLEATAAAPPRVWGQFSYWLMLLLLACLIVETAVIYFGARRLEKAGSIRPASTQRQALG